jgi:hypothetical protein
VAEAVVVAAESTEATVVELEKEAEEMGEKRIRDKKTRCRLFRHTFMIASK